jgi:hypothetical protein
MIFFRFFINFVSSCTQYVHDEPICTGYVPLQKKSLENIYIKVVVEIVTTCTLDSHQLVVIE